LFSFFPFSLLKMTSTSSNIPHSYKDHIHPLPTSFAFITQ
jgi:hypothetical protein